MKKILVVAEQAGDGVDDSALEMLTAAAGFGDSETAAVILGHDLKAAATELTRWTGKVHALEHPSLEWPDGDLAARALAPLLRREQPWLTLIPHSNRGLELAPLLAARVDAPLIADCDRLTVDGERLVARRRIFGGKVDARVSAAPGNAGVIASVRPGSTAVPTEAPEAGGVVISESLPDGAAARRRHLEMVEAAGGDVDISQSERLVAVGRGLEDEDNLEMVESLAEALGAELAATRPVVDKKWLERARQVGTSGTAVKPKLYLTLGVSGSFQHMGGVKGEPFIAAVNKDPAAPIFDVASVGIVGELQELVPLIEQAIRERKG